MSKNDLRIATRNANGVLNRKEELQIFLHLQNIDICLLSETHLTTQSYLKIRGYKTYNANHPLNQANGGSAILIKEHINHHMEQTVQREEYQLTAICVNSVKQKLIIGAVYCPPRHNLKKPDYTTLLNYLGERFILGGDYNAKHLNWGSRITTTKGRELKAALREKGCDIRSTARPTYWPSDPRKTPDLLDFFITRKVALNFTDVNDNFDVTSDHSAVILTLSHHIIKKENKPYLTNRTTDWLSFREELGKNIQLNVQLKNRKQLDTAAEQFIAQIQEAAWNNTKPYTYKTVGNNYPFEIRELVRDKRRARRKWQTTRNAADKTKLNNLTQQLKREIINLKQSSIKCYLRELTNERSTDYSLWRATRKLKKPITYIPPLRKTNGNWAKSAKEKAEAFANYLEQTFQHYTAQNNSMSKEEYNNQDDEKIPLVTPKEFANEIKVNLNPKKAPGYDLITDELLKNLPKKAIVMLTYLFNAVIRLQHMPSCWKVAEMIMLHKLGKPANEVKSYRPISLLPIISKLFEKLLLKRLKPIIENKNLIPSHQFGFRQQHNTIDQVHRITNVIEEALEGRETCSAVFLDVAQAFDKVWHQGLMSKLNKILPKQYVHLLESYVTGRIFRVKQEDEYSQFKDIKAGVPQGSILGPVLYLLYTHDIPKGNNITMATFADDTAILAVGREISSSTKRLQSACDKITEWTRVWRIKLNEAKSVNITFTNKRIEGQHNVNMNGIVIPYANTAKYLGMTLDIKLKWKEHVKKKKKELVLKYKKMY
jgi:hypothetical protein